MMHSRWHLPCLMTVLAPLGACAVDAADSMATDLPGMASALDSATESPASGSALETLAEVAIPTEDGKASYRFRFARVDGVVLTTVEVPFGHRMPVVPTECALETFLRVAPADSVVPPALIEHCLTPAERAERGLSVAGEAPVQAASLRDPASRLELDHQLAGALCNIEDFEERAEKLEALAAYVPDVVQCQPGPCEYAVIWDQSGCGFIDEDGNNQGLCDPAYHALLLFGAPLGGYECLQEGDPTCVTVPNLLCSHGSAVFADFGPYWAWERLGEDVFSPGKTTYARVEVQVCDLQESGTGWWRMKTKPSNPYGPQHPLAFPAGHTTKILLTAGADNDMWNGMDFWVRAEGDDVRVISAWLAMKGLNYSECPILL